MLDGHDLYAEQAFHNAIKLDPEYAVARHWYAVYCGAIGDLRGRAENMEVARRLDPGSLIMAVDQAISLSFDGRSDAEKILREVLETAPQFWRADLELGRHLMRQGRYHEAVRHFEQAISRSGEIPWTDGHLAWAHSKAGNLEPAPEELQRMQRRATGAYVAPTGFALAHAGLGEMERCFEWLHRAVDEKDPRFMAGITWAVPEITQHPRWTEILERMDYPRVGASTPGDE